MQRSFVTSCVLLFCAFAGAVGLVDCSHLGGFSGEHHSDTITFNISEDPHSLNPILAQSDDERQIAHLMFDLLLDVDAHGRLVPALALQVPTKANGGISPDGRTIVYHLRDNVRWQDGQPVTASDVIFTWQAVTDPSNDVQSTRGYDLIDLIYAPDSYTVVMHLKRAWPPAVATFFTYGTNPIAILPAHLFANHPSLRDASFNTHPVGSGPYELLEWQRGDRLVLQANPLYFKGRARTSKIVVQEVPDTNSAFIMLRSGQLDWSLQSPAQRLAMGTPTSVHYVYAPFAGFGAIVFNCRRPPLDDVRMRRAIALSIDRERLAASITGGQYRVTNSDQPIFSWAYDPSAQLPPYKPAQADAIFDSLGYRRGADGVRRRNGRPLALTFTTFPESDTAVRTAEYVQQMLRERGIDVAIKKVTLAQFYLPASQGGLLLSGRFDLAYMAWRSGVDPDDSDLVTCSGVANYAGYCNAQLDSLETQALSKFDLVSRRIAYARVQHMLASDIPYEFLYAPRYSFAVQNSIRGFAPTPFSPTWNAYQWSVIK